MERGLSICFPRAQFHEAQDRSRSTVDVRGRILLKHLAFSHYPSRIVHEVCTAGILVVGPARLRPIPMSALLVVAIFMPKVS
jgi:hypothetical protein